MNTITRWAIKVLTEVLAKLRFAEVVADIIRGDIGKQIAMMQMTPYYPFHVKGHINIGDEVVINISLSEIHNLTEARAFAANGPMILVHAWAIRNFPAGGIVPFNTTNISDASCGFSATVPDYGSIIGSRHSRLLS